jgi:hypothetical protein
MTTGDSAILVSTSATSLCNLLGAHHEGSAVQCPDYCSCQRVSCLLVLRTSYSSCGMTACSACGADAVEEVDGEMMCMDCGETDQQQADQGASTSGYKERSSALLLCG